jgi:hypothetical protein
LIVSFLCVVSSLHNHEPGGQVVCREIQAIEAGKRFASLQSNVIARKHLHENGTNIGSGHLGGIAP